jgi:hypothetical protein
MESLTSSSFSKSDVEVVCWGSLRGDLSLDGYLCDNLRSCKLK